MLCKARKPWTTLRHHTSLRLHIYILSGNSVCRRRNVYSTGCGAGVSTRHASCDPPERECHTPVGSRSLRREPVLLLQAECVQHGLRTLAFCKTRKLCELVTAYTRETLRDTAPHLCDTISVYRAGYSPQVCQEPLPGLASSTLGRLKSRQQAALRPTMPTPSPLRTDCSPRGGVPGTPNSAFCTCSRGSYPDFIDENACASVKGMLRKHLAIPDASGTADWICSIIRTPC